MLQFFHEATTSQCFLYNFLLNFAQIVKFNFLIHLTQHNLLWMILGCFTKAHKLMICYHWRFPQHQGDGKTPMLGKTEEQKEKRVAQDEMAGWHHWFNGHELGQSPGDSEGQGGLACCSPRGRKQLDTTGWLNNSKVFEKDSTKWNLFPKSTEEKGTQWTLRCMCLFELQFSLVYAQ